MNNSKTKIFDKIGHVADRVEIAIGSIAFAFMCIFVLTTIVYRYVLHMPIMWTEEASRYLMITGIFFAMPVAVREHVHLGVEVFVNLFPENGRKVFNVFTEIVSLIAYVAIDLACWKFVLKTAAGNQTSPAMHIPMIIMYSIIMIGFVLATIAQIGNMVAMFMNLNKKDGEEEAMS